ncbi:MAG: VWA domain-containing protein [Gammaproteobacteria bacterium]|nr:VWA domain-containing protein [Gammaproteobacteria bacterium]
MKLPYLILSLLLTLSVAGSVVAATPPPEATAPTYDIRILIDVSGSMKQNDPANLRKPALRLLTGLLPSGTQAGVWTFARYVNMLVRYGEVNSAWREQAKGAADQIGSVGLFTDIESALDKASWNWKDTAPVVHRSVILLTDGLVDISDTPESDRLSRARITGEILPRLQSAGVEVYSIALSDGADETLLQQLSASTGGWFERADTAEALERIFLRMFEKAANPDTLPLIDNQVLVDDSIEELTLLVFRAKGAPATTLTTPDGATFDTPHMPPNARWHSDARYDLITIEKPTTGIWHVNAETDPDNRVMVVSNLRVVATELPNQVLSGDMHDLLVRFTQQNQPITSKEFLNFLTVKVLESSAEGPAPERPLFDNGRDGDIVAGDGVFSTQLSASEEPGPHTIVVDVDGTTFKRQHRQDIEVVESPVIADVRTDENGTALFVIPRAGIIDPETLQATATITSEEGQAETHPVIRMSPGEWRLGLEAYPPEGSYELVLDIEAERPNGKPIHYQGKPLSFGLPVSPNEEDPVADEDEPQEEEAVTEDDTVEDDEELNDEPASVNWILVITIVTLLNALIGGALFLVYRKLFGGSAESADEEDEEEAAENSPREDKDASVATATPDVAPTPFDDTKPSIVTQITEAASTQESTPPVLNEATASHEDSPAEMEMEVTDPGPSEMLDESETPNESLPPEAATPELVMEETEGTEPDSIEKVGGPDARTGARPSEATSPELVMEEDVDTPNISEFDDHLKNLNVDEIDLGLEEKIRNTG